MAVQIGKDNTIHINDDVLKVICQTLRKYHYETGGIIGTNEKGVITAFQLDEIQKPTLYEYYPNTEFLNSVINEKWKEKYITFAGFVHSHLNNDNLSFQDIKYARKILKANNNLDNILIGVINLNTNHNIKWYIVN